jgi:hypothetical protein
MIANEVHAAATAAPAPASGQGAVDRSSAEKALAGAQGAPAVIMPPGLGGVSTDEYGNVISPVRYVGDKTFILSDGVWTDTTFDPDTMKTVQVSFGSDDYFALMASRPEWGRYFALGDHVIVLLEGTAYEVREGAAPPVTPPASVTPATGASPGQTPIVGPTPTPPANTLDRMLQTIRDWIAKVAKLFRK